jgi:hypothetical protein
MALPAAYLTLWFLAIFGLQLVGLFSEPSAAAVVAALLFFGAFAAIAAGWTLLIRFVARGIAGLCQVKLWWWWVAMSGAILSIASIIAFRIDMVAEARFTSEVAWATQFLQYGGFFLIPLGHLVLERVIRGRKLTMRWSGP